MQKDNSTFAFKRALRQKALALVADPVILETHGGYGVLYEALYRSVERGAVIEKHEGKASFLARQRPTWAVYQADAAKTLTLGAGRHLPVNFLDLDPYGDPWPVLDAFLTSDRPRPERMVIVVNDGLRQKVKLGGAWSAGSLSGAVQRFGNNLHAKYLQVCRWLMEQKAAQAGYDLSSFAGYYCGFNQQMTHYLAVLSYAEARAAD